jgi:hypothetical protein
MIKLIYFDTSLTLTRLPLGVLLPDSGVDLVPVEGGALRLSRHLAHDGVHSLAPLAGYPVHQLRILAPLIFLVGK